MLCKLNFSKYCCALCKVFGQPSTVFIAANSLESESATVPKPSEVPNSKMVSLLKYFAKRNSSFCLFFFIPAFFKTAVTFLAFPLKNVHNDSVIIFDDIYWSKDMTDAWWQIIANEKVTLSIDTFQWGMVFFRKEQPKQHFVIRIAP